MVKSAIYKYLFTKSPYIILGFITLNFVLDFIDKIDIFYTIGFIKYNRILKLILAVYGLIFIVTHLKFIFKQYVYILQNVKYNFTTLFLL